MRKKEPGLPLVIGVTGHRDLRTEDENILRDIVRDEITALKERYPHTPLVMINGMAEGADLLCAEASIAQGINVIAVLSRPLASFRTDFQGEALTRFDTLIAQAEKVFVVPEMEGLPEDMSNDHGYRQVGLYIAKHAQLLLALWDGSPPKANGCGTAEVVDFVLHEHFPPASGILDTNDGVVIAIRTPRRNHPEIANPFCVEKLGAYLQLETSLAQLEAFNAEKEPAVNGEEDLIDSALLHSDDGLEKMNALYARASRLSTMYRDRYMRCMRWLSILSVAVVVAFLLYDELESDAFLPLCGVFLLIALGYLYRVRRGKYHMHYLKYRMLAETIRVQFYLALAGIDACVTDWFVWSQRCESRWIVKAMPALLAGYKAAPTAKASLIEATWIDKQLAYHQQKGVAIGQQERVNGRTSSVMLSIAVFVYLCVCIIEFLPFSTMGVPLPMDAVSSLLMMHEGQEPNIRSLVKITLGIVSAVSLFLSSYYGKLSLRRKLSDSEQMALLFTQAKKALASGMPSEQVFVQLAKAEIAENCIWLSYCQDNTPEVNV